LNDPDSLALFFFEPRNYRVIELVRPLDNSQYQPFIQCLLDELVMHLQNLDFLPVNWIMCFEMDFLREVLGQAQVIFVDVERILVLV